MLHYFKEGPGTRRRLCTLRRPGIRRHPNTCRLASRRRRAAVGGGGVPRSVQRRRTLALAGRTRRRLDRPVVVASPEAAAAGAAVEKGRAGPVIAERCGAGQRPVEAAMSPDGGAADSSCVASGPRPGGGTSLSSAGGCWWPAVPPGPGLRRPPRRLRVGWLRLVW